MKKKFIVFNFIFIYLNVFAQNPEIDSVRKFIANAKVDTIRINAQMDLMDMLNATDDEWYIINQEIEKECITKIQTEKGKRLYYFKQALAVAWSNNGYKLEKIGERDQADAYYLKSVNLFAELKYEFGVAKLYNNMAFNQNRNGNIPKAIEYNLKALEVFKKLKKDDDIANSLINLAAINYNQDQWPEALSYLKEAEQILLKTRDDKTLSRCYLNLSAGYRSIKDSVNMFHYFQKSVDLLKKMEDKEGLAVAYNNLATYYREKKDYKNASNWVQKGLELRKRINDKKGTVSSLINYSRILSAQEKWDSTKIVLDEAATMLQSLKIPEYLQNLHEEYYKYYVAKNDSEKALEHYRKHILFKDSLQNDKNRKLSLKQTMQYEYDKKELQNKELLKRQQLEFEFKRKEDALLAQNEIKDIAANEQFKRKRLAYEFEAKQKIQKADAEKKELEYKESIKRKEIENRNQRILSLFFIVGFLLMVALSYFIFRGLQQNRKAKEIIEKQKLLVEEKQKEVIDSINYAKRIQHSILPTEKYIHKNIQRMKRN